MSTYASLMVNLYSSIDRIEPKSIENVGSELVVDDLDTNGTPVFERLAVKCHLNVFVHEL